MPANYARLLGGIASFSAPQKHTQTQTFRLVKFRSRTIATIHSAGVHLHSLLTLSLRAWQQTSNSKCCIHMHAPSQILIPLSKKTINFPTQGTMQLRFLDHGGSQTNIPWQFLKGQPSVFTYAVPILSNKRSTSHLTYPFLRLGCSSVTSNLMSNLVKELGHVMSRLIIAPVWRSW